MAKVYAFMAAGLEEVECLAVVDVLRRASVEVVLVSMEAEAVVTGAHNIRILADCLFEEMDYHDGDLFFLPGGLPGTTNLGNHRGLCELLLQANRENKRIAAICAAPSILGQLGILEGKEAICYPGYEEQLKGSRISEKGVVTDSNITTAKGLGYGLLMGFELIRLLVDEKTATKIRQAIQYPTN